MIYFRCPKCRAQLSVSESMAGGTKKCAECGNVTFIPSPALSPNAAASTAQLEHDQEQTGTEVEAGEPTILWCGRPSWKSFLVRYSLTVLVGMVGMVLLVFVRGWWVWLGWPILLPAALVLGVMQVRRKCTRYRVTSQSISMEWGVFNRTGNEIPVSHVREVQMTQGLIERILDVGSLGFATAASGRQEVIFHGIRSPKSVRDLVRAQIR